MDITLTIPTEKIAEFKIGFLKSHPIPLDSNGNPEFTAMQWVRHCVKYMLISWYKNGKIELTEEAALEDVIIDEDIIS